MDSIEKISREEIDYFNKIYLQLESFQKIPKPSETFLKNLHNIHSMAVTKTKKNEMQKLKPKIANILKKRGIKRAGIFGSYARGDYKKTSDIDILVEIPRNMKFSLLDFVGLKYELEDAIGKKVDLVEYVMIRPELKKSILKEEVTII